MTKDELAEALAAQRTQIAADMDDRLRLILRGEDAKGKKTGHPDNLRSIHEDTAAVRKKLGA